MGDRVLKFLDVVAAEKACGPTCLAEIESLGQMWGETQEQARHARALVCDVLLFKAVRQWAVADLATDQGPKARESAMGLIRDQLAFATSNKEGINKSMLGEEIVTKADAILDGCEATQG